MLKKFVRNFKNKNFKRWFWQSVIGLLVLQSGLCLVIESAFIKHSQEAENWQWIVAGTISLAVFYAGVSLTVDGIRYRIKWQEEKNESFSAK